MIDIGIFITFIIYIHAFTKTIHINITKNKTKKELIKEKLVDESLIGFNVDNKYKTYDENTIKSIATTLTKNYSVMAFNIYGGLNMGTIIRTSVICSADSFYYAGYREFDRRTMVGAQNYISIKRINNIIYQNSIDELPSYNVDNFIEFINENNLIPIFIEQDGIPLSEINFKDIKNNIENNNKKMVIIFGSESFGIPKCIIETTKLFNHSIVISIEQTGILHSHNVAVASGIILYNLSQSL